MWVGYGIGILLALQSVLKLWLRRRDAAIHDLELANSPAPVILWGTFQVALAMVIGLVLQRPG